jgi:signal transduction histidine kinase
MSAKAPALLPPTPDALLAATLRLSKELSLDLPEETTLLRFLDTLKELLPGRALCLRVVDEKRHEIQAILNSAPEGVQPDAEAQRGPLRVKRAALRHTGLPAAIATSARIVLTERHTAVFSGTAGGFSVPLVAGGELLGMMHCEYPGPDRPPAEGLRKKDEAAVIPLCNQLSVALRNLRLLQHLERVRTLERQVLQAERLATLGQLAAGVVHELNNPLSSIAAYGDQLARRLQQAGAAFQRDAEMARRICEGTERIQRLTRDLMSYGRPTGEPELLSLAEVVAQALSFCDHVLLRSGARLSERYEGEAVYVRGVRTQLQQVVVNLLTNACHAVAGGERGRDQIQVRTAPATLLGAPAVQLTVSDTGGGIPEPLRERIFEPFFSTKSAGVGTGLGLPIVKNIVEAHGGQVSFETQVGRGTTFRVILPAVSETSA